MTMAVEDVTDVEELVELTERGSGFLPLINASRMPPNVDLAEMHILDWSTRLDGGVLRIVWCALWAGDFGWYRIVGFHPAFRAYIRNTLLLKHGVIRETELAELNPAPPRARMH